MVSRLAVAGAPQSYFISHKNVKVQINNFENSFLWEHDFYQERLSESRPPVLLSRLQDWRAGP
jgi:hypothetical protein